MMTETRNYFRKTYGFCIENIFEIIDFFPLFYFIIQKKGEWPWG